MNLTIREGILFRDLRSRGDAITVKIAPRDFKRLRPILRKTGCSVQILEKRGGLLLSLIGKNRKSLLLGLLFFCLLLFFLSSFVWNITITGNEAVSNNVIMSALKKCGVTMGISKRQLDLPQLEKDLLLEIGELSWVGARLRGVYLEVQVVERRREPVGLGEAFDLVAAKDGLVVDILVLAGEAAVEAGETVRKGQLLISGPSPSAMYPDPREETGEDASGGIYEGRERARGMAMAQVWYEAFAEAPLYVVQKTRTGITSRSLSLIMDGQDRHLWGSRDTPFRNYEVEKTRYALAWRNLRFPVEVVDNRYLELAVSIKTVPPGDALQEARKQALREVSGQLPRGGSVVKKRYVDDYLFPELGTAGARVMIETLEDIAVPFNLNNMDSGSDVFS